LNLLHFVQHNGHFMIFFRNFFSRKRGIPILEIKNRLKKAGKPALGGGGGLREPKRICKNYQYCFAYSRTFTNFVKEMKSKEEHNNRIKASQQRMRLFGYFGNNLRIALILADDDHLPLEEIKINPELKALHNSHERLVYKVGNDLKSPLDSLNLDLHTESYQTLNTYFENKLIQIMRLRMVLCPEYQKSIQTHTVTGRKYLVLKALWMDDQMTKKIISSISLGNVENVGSLIDPYKPEIIAAKKELQKKLIFIYNETYPQE